MRQWLWNSELTYSFLKGKRGLLKFQVVDILQQRDFVNRWMNETGQAETWTWGLLRYAMATFTYRFNDLSRQEIKKELIQEKRISSFLNIPKKDYL